MNSSQILWPMLAQIALTILMYVVLGVRKANAVKLGRVNRKEVALDNRVWPSDVAKVSNNIAKQFESPILFYVLCLLLFSINGVGLTALVLAWVYALTRYAHAYVHVGSNYVPTRFRIFILSCLILLAMAVLAARGLIARHIA
jgi:hypothetical protein